MTKTNETIEQFYAGKIAQLLLEMLEERSKQLTDAKKPDLQSEPVQEPGPKLGPRQGGLARTVDFVDDERTNDFITSPAMDYHKEDVAIDKLLSGGNPQARVYKRQAEIRSQLLQDSQDRLLEKYEADLQAIKDKYQDDTQDDWCVPHTNMVQEKNE